MGDGETLVLSAERAMPPGVDVGQVFEMSYRKLVVQMYGIVGNAGEAEDLVQEAFVRAYAAGSRFTRVDNPEAWLRTTALNLYRNRWRKMRNFGRIKHRLHETPDLQCLDAHVEVVDALRQLPESQREVIVLHYFADRQVDQIAGELGIAEGTVKSRLSRGRDALATILKEDGR
jgi:RNA polymerase sigma-70 factor (ECF subfamily)